MRSKVVVGSSEGARRTVTALARANVTLRELADEYRRADQWARDVLEGPVPRLQAGDLAIAQDAAFHAYARGARDYEP